ncbi:MAG: hypothetical protein FWD87_05050 [Spirochaetaceae bacterium]|nr:hypothetical protein [Spirochaetaceae bacterium]
MNIKNMIESGTVKTNIKQKHGLKMIEDACWLIINHCLIENDDEFREAVFNKFPDQEYFDKLKVFILDYATELMDMLLLASENFLKELADKQRCNREV